MIFIESASVVLGIVLYSLVEVKISLIWTCFAMLPLEIITFIIFLGKWITNDYMFYEKKVKSDDEKEEENNENPAQAHSKKKALMFNKESFVKELCDIFKCKKKPKTRKDKIMVTLTALLCIFNIAFIVVTMTVYNPTWVGFTIGIWIFIGQFITIIFTKFYQTYYQSVLII